MKRGFALLPALLACLPAIAQPLPARISAEYELVNNGLTIGRVQESFVRTDDRYEIRSVSRSEGILKLLYDEQITLTSRGKVAEKGLVPEQFEEQRARDPKRNVSATFDWARGQMQSRYRGEVKTVVLPPGTQDRISLMYQFMMAKPRKGSTTLAMSNGRKVERYSYRVVDEERITTPAGDYDTVHFERVATEPNDRHVDVWLAKEQHFFPVRVVFEDPRGLRIEQRLVSLRFG